MSKHRFAHTNDPGSLLVRKLKDLPKDDGHLLLRGQRAGDTGEAESDVLIHIE
jgi:hypothetical protein